MTAAPAHRAVPEVHANWVLGPEGTRDMEKAVLGEVIQSREMTEAVAAILAPDAWTVPRHALIFEAACALAEKGEPVTPATVLAVMQEQGTLLPAGRGEYLHDCQAAAAGGAVFLARRLAAGKIRRDLALVGERLIQASTDAACDPDELIERTLQQIGGIAAGQQVEELPSMVEVLSEVMLEIEHPTRKDGIPLPVQDLNLLLNGLHPGRVLVIGARPAIGKTTLALDIARFAAVRCGYRTIIFSLEMTRQELMRRLLSSEALVPHHAIETSQVEEGDWPRLTAAYDRIAPAPLLIDDSGLVSMNHMRMRAARQVRRGEPLRVVVIDYLQLMQTARGDNRQEQVAELSRAIKLFAKEFKVAVVLCAQLNRGPEARQDKRPVLSDLRESGAVEQDADTVILLHRDDAYERLSPRAGEADLIVAKNRNGPTATVIVAFQGHYARFVDMAPGDDDEWQRRGRPSGTAAPDGEPPDDWDPGRILDTMLPGTAGVTGKSRGARS